MKRRTPRKVWPKVWLKGLPGWVWFRLRRLWDNLFAAADDCLGAAWDGLGWCLGRGRPQVRPKPRPVPLGVEQLEGRRLLSLSASGHVLVGLEGQTVSGVIATVGANFSTASRQRCSGPSMSRTCLLARNRTSTRQRLANVAMTHARIARRAFLPQIAKESSGPVRRLDQRLACERRLLDLGVNYTLHTDSGVRWTPIDRIDLGLQAAVRELKLTPAEALTAGTRTAAEALRLADRGTLVAGKRADLGVVEGNPLQDIACVGQVRAVLKAGRWVAV